MQTALDPIELPNVTVSGALHSEAATASLAKAVGDVLKPGDTLLLTGALGAGKTFFARSLIQSQMKHFGLLEDVPSPSFTLVQTYEIGEQTLWHVDLYRLSGSSEVLELGLDEAMENEICLVEWPDRLGPLQPLHAIDLVIEDLGDARRQITITGPDTPATQRILAAASSVLLTANE